MKPLCLVLLMLLCISCSGQQSESVETIRVGVLPDQKIDIIRQNYQPLLQFLHQSTGFKYRLVVPQTYDELLSLFAQGQLELALFGGATFIEAMQQYNAQALVMRNIDTEFVSIIITSKQHPAKNLDDLKDTHLAFGPRLSTSGHLMARFFLRNERISAESYFRQISYSSGHDATVQWVNEGKVDAGVLNKQIFQKMLADGRIDKESVKVIWQSPGYANYVWAVPPRLNKTQRQSIKDAFLALGQTPEDHDLLSALGAKYFVPAKSDDFAQIQRAIIQYQQQSQD